jgi:hypothetical protein
LIEESPRTAGSFCLSRIDVWQRKKQSVRQSRRLSGSNWLGSDAHPRPSAKIRLNPRFAVVVEAMRRELARNDRVV